MGLYAGIGKSSSMLDKDFPILLLWGYLGDGEAQPIIFYLGYGPLRPIKKRIKHPDVLTSVSLFLSELLMFVGSLVV